MHAMNDERTFDAFSQAWFDDEHHKQANKKTNSTCNDDIAPQLDTIEVEN